MHTCAARLIRGGFGLWMLFVAASCTSPASQRQRNAGAVKPRNSLLRELVLGVLAGAFIGFGFSTCMLAAGQVSRACSASQARFVLCARAASSLQSTAAWLPLLKCSQMTKEQREEHVWIFNLAFGAYGFPVGLAMCVINGASLFTSNIAYMSTAVIQRKAAVHQALRVLIFSYFANLAGAWACCHCALRCVECESTAHHHRQ